MNDAFSAIEDRLVKYFQEFVSALPAGCANLRVKRAPEIQHRGVSVWLTPSDPKAAQIVVDAQNGDSTVVMSLGRCTPIEVLPSKGSTVEEDIREVYQAVIDGKFEEDLWLVGSEVTKCIGKIEYGGKVHVFRYYGGFFPLRKKERKHIRYSPYIVPTY